jgi:hypothetical protein
MKITTKKEASISEELLDKIKAKLKSLPPAEFYWDYRDELNEEQVSKILSGPEGINDVADDIFENNYDNVYDLEINQIVDALEWFKDEIEAELDEEHVDLKEVAAELRDDLLDLTQVDFNIKQLLKNTGNANVRIVLYSNNDCINSCWFESVANGGYQYDGYFKDILDRLYLNPRKVKEMFEERGITTKGNFPNKKRRDGKEYVDYKAFAIEMENDSCGAGLLTIVAQVDLCDIYEKGSMPTKFIIPKGNNLGIFSDWQGGGSMIECPLLRDMKIDTKKTFGSEYDHWGLVPDTKEHGYTMKNDVYGVTNDFFCGEIIPL